MGKFKIIIAISFLLVLLGCKEGKKAPSTQDTSSPSATISPTDNSNSVTSPINPTTPPTTNSSSSQTPVTAIPNSTQTGKNQLISADSIGPAKVGMTMGQLKQLMAGKAEFQVQSPFIVDFDAIAVTQGGKVQFYILYPAGSPLADSDIIEALITDNPNYRTAEGIGPGTPIQKAKAVYGDATLSYSTFNESREYVKFAKQPSKSMSFRLGAANDGSLAGVYPELKGESNETKEFKKNASIRFVEVYCGQNCPPPSPF